MSAVAHNSVTTYGFTFSSAITRAMFSSGEVIIPGRGMFELLSQSRGAGLVAEALAEFEAFEDLVGGHSHPQMTDAT